MTIQAVSSFAAGAWVPPGEGARPIESAITGEVIAQAGNASRASNNSCRYWQLLLLRKLATDGSRSSSVS